MTRAPRRGLDGRTVLLVVGGGIAAYKCLHLIRRLRERGARVRPVMSGGAGEFVTATSLGALSGERVFDSLTDRDAEHDVGHIRLARETDIVVVAPATASLMAAMAGGFAGDLATAVLLATRAPVLIAPAMNPAMWDHPATRRNLATLQGDGVHVIGPEGGEMAESGEAGTGRLSEPDAILARIEAMLAQPDGPLTGTRMLVTSGPTHEPIDPVRYIANRSSGRQGHAIAGALAGMGADVTLVSGPVAIPDPPGCAIVRVETAREMETAALRSLPVDAAIMVAAVADWRVGEVAATKMKTGEGAPTLATTLNPDILATIGHHERRPALVVGFAAETDDVEANATAKLARKGADWIVANDVSGDVMGGAENTVAIVSTGGVERWERMGKDDVARRLAGRIAIALGRAAPGEVEGDRPISLDAAVRTDGSGVDGSTE